MKRYKLLILGLMVTQFALAQRTEPKHKDITVFTNEWLVASYDGDEVRAISSTGFPNNTGILANPWENFGWREDWGGGDCNSSETVFEYYLEPVTSYTGLHYESFNGSVDGDVTLGFGESGRRNAMPGHDLYISTSNSGETLDLAPGTYQLEEKYREYQKSGNSYDYTWKFILDDIVYNYCDEGSLVGAGDVGNVNLRVIDRSSINWNSAYYNNGSTYETCAPPSGEIDLGAWVNWPYSGKFYLINGSDTLWNAIDEDFMLSTNEVVRNQTYELHYVVLNGLGVIDWLGEHFPDDRFREQENVAYDIEEGNNGNDPLVNVWWKKIIQPISIHDDLVTYFDIPDEICEGEFLDLLDFTDASFDDATFSGNGVDVANKTLTWNSPGTYTISLSATDENGCTYTLDDDILFGASLNVNVASDADICIGDSYQLSASGGTNYFWSPSNGLNDNTIDNPIATPTATTTYQVSVSSPGACDGSASVTVTVNDLPTVTAGNDVIICNGESTQLQAGGASSYLWTPATGLDLATLSNPVANPSTTTTYTVTGTDGNGCVNTDQVTITVNPIPTTTTSDDESICEGETTQIQATGGVSYQWTNGSSLSNDQVANPIASPMSTTIYEVEIVGVNGCTVTDQVIITVNDNPTADAGDNTEICLGDETTLSGLGAGAGGSYSWIPTSGLNNANIQNPNASPVSTTNYTLTVTTASGCVDTDNVIVTVNEPSTLTISAGGLVTTSTEICEGDSEELRANMSGAVSYSWIPTTGISNPIVQSPIVSPSVNTTYSVTVTDGNGCERTESINVVVNDLPNGGVTFGSGSVCDGSTIELQAFGGTSYSWSGSNLNNPNIPNPIASPTTTTVYEVEITNDDGCSVTEQVTVTVNDSRTALAGDDIDVCLGSGVQLNGSGAGTGGSYVWTPTTGLNNVNIQNPIASPSVTTDYTLTVTDVNGCSGSDIIRVNVNEPGTLTITADNAVTTSKEICSGESVLLDAIMSNSSTYVWSPASDISNTIIRNPTVDPSSTTTYSVTVTDDDGCQRTESIQIIVNDPPVATINGANFSICPGETQQLIAGGGSSYSWSGSGLSNNTVSNPIASPSVTTLYVVTVTDSNGCVDTEQIQVTVNDLPVANAGNNAQICLGENVSLSASGAGVGGSYEWSPSGSLNNGFIQNPVATPSETTTYTVTVTDANGCSDSDEVEIVVNEPAVIVTTIEGVVANADEMCEGESLQLLASMNDAVSYTWTPSIGLNNPNITNPIATPSSTTTYSVTITDDNGCENTTSVNITVNELPNGSVSFSNASICEGEDIGLNAFGGDSYSWTGSNLTNANIANPIASPTNTTLYEVEITNEDGCSTTEQILITVNDVPEANAGNEVEFCLGDSETLSGSGAGSGGTYAWTPTTGLSNPSISNPEASPNETTVYTLTVTNADGCSDTDMVTVMVNEAGSVITTVDGMVTNGGGICDGNSINLGATMSGGVTYSWVPTTGLNNPFIQNPTASPTVSTTYTVTVTDGNGCQNSASVVIGVNELPAAGVANDQVAMCLGSSVQIEAFGGTSYSWTGDHLNNSNIANPTASPPSSTVYEVTITNNDGCSVTDQVIVTVNNLPSASAGSDREVCLGESTTLFGSGADSGGSYVWSPSQGLNNPNIQSPSASPLETTQYTLTVTDSNGCQDTDVTLVTVNEPENVVTTVGGVVNNVATICEGEEVELGANMVGGQSYLWNPSSGLNNPFIASPTASPDSDITYTVTITDGNGCENSAVMNINVNEPPNGGVTFSSTSICQGESVNLAAFGGTSYAWSGPNISNENSSTPSVTPEGSAQYEVVITDDNGCSITDHVFVNVNIPPEAVTSSGKTICSGESVEIFASGAGTGGSYIWSPAGALSNPFVTNPVASPIETTLFQVTITDANGCEDVATVEVIVNEPGNVLTFADDNLTSNFDVCLGSQVQLKAEMSNAASYQWSPSTGLNSNIVQSPIATVSSTLTYTVTGTDLNGCQETAQITVNALESPTLDLGDPITICDNEDPIDLRAFSNLTNVSFVGTGVSGITFNPSVGAGVWFVTGTFEQGDCNSSDVLEIQVIAGSVASAIDDQNICFGESVQLNASGGTSYFWSPGLSLNDPNVRNPIATPDETITYSVIVTDGNGCEDVDEVTINVHNEAQGEISAESNVYTAGDLVSFDFDQLTSWTIDEYDWDFGNGGSSNQAVANYYFYVPGAYTITLDVVTDQGCESSFSYDLTIVEDEDPIIVGAEEKLEELKIYPNPFIDGFYLETASVITKLEVVNISGKTVYVLEPRLGENYIDISRFPEGVYFISWINGKNQVETQKVIKR